MSYEKEVAELWKEWKKSTEKYEEAIEDGYDVDAEMWANDVETIHRQIHLYEQADKADEYEVKAKSWDKLMFEIDEINDEVVGKELPSKIIMAAKITALSNVIKEHESGGYDA